MNAGTTLQFFQFNQNNGDGIAMPITLNGATLSDGNQTHATTVTVPVTLNAANTFNIGASTGFTFTGDIGGTGGMTKTGNGLLILKSDNDNNSIGGTLGASAGKVRLDTNLKGSGGLSATGTGIIELAEDGSHNKFIRTGDVTYAGTGKIDLKDNKLLSTMAPGTVDQTTFLYSGLQGAVQHAYNSQSWDQGGLTTSEAAATTGLTTIGITTGAARAGLGPTDTDLFGGQTYTGATTIAMYTYAGDANLDGLIDGGDYGIIDNNVTIPGADGYYNGDFNYDGVIDGGDYGIIDNNITAQGAPFPVSGAVSGGSSSAGLAGVTAVPEPASLSVLGLGAAALFGGRRRRRRRHSDPTT
jgi:hypothetical protein